MNDYEWLVKKSWNKELGRYTGEWIVVKNKKIVAHGKDFELVIKKFQKKFPEARPFVVRIPEPAIIIAQLRSEEVANDIFSLSS